MQVFAQMVTFEQTLFIKQGIYKSMWYHMHNNQATIITTRHCYTIMVNQNNLIAKKWCGQAKQQLKGQI